MARPTNKEQLERANQLATERIRKDLPALADRLVKMALEKQVIKVVCPKDKHTFEVETDGLKNPDLVLDLWTRAEGRPSEQKQLTEIERFAALIGELRVIQSEEDIDSSED